MRKIGFINSISIGIILLLWISVFFMHGLVGAYAWTLLKMILPIIGALGIFINGVLLVIFLVKKKKSIKLFVNFMINVVVTFPIFMTMNVILFAYPNDINRAEPSITVKWPFTEQTIVG